MSFRGKSLSGFTLIEVAIVLCIIGVLSGIGIPAINSYIKHQKARKTEDHLEQILQSLTAYLLNNKSLPCPSNPKASAEETGTSDQNCSFEDTTVGLVPYRTLGIPEKIAKDGYHHWITYAVDPALSNPDIKYLNAPDDVVLPNLVFCEVQSGATPLNVTGPDKQSVLDPSSQAKDPIALVLVSHGPSGDGSFDDKGDRRSPASPDKGTNADSTANFVDRTPSFNKGDFFDDTVKWVTRNNLMALYGKQICVRRND